MKEKILEVPFINMPIMTGSGGGGDVAANCYQMITLCWKGEDWQVTVGSPQA